MSDITLDTDIEVVPLDQLEPYAQNPKNHPPDQVETIKESIRNFGFDQPIVVNESGDIIKGHGRYQAAQEMDLKNVPVIWKDHLGPDEVKGARIADNQASLSSGFDVDLLQREIEDIDSLVNDRGDVGTLTGMDGLEIDAMLDKEAKRDRETIENQPVRDMGEQDGSTLTNTEESESDGEPEEQDGGGESHSKPWEVECPHCGHDFSAGPGDMGE